jgi:hypothetical protein
MLAGAAPPPAPATAGAGLRRPPQSFGPWVIVTGAVYAGRRGLLFTSVVPLAWRPRCDPGAARSLDPGVTADVLL